MDRGVEGKTGAADYFFLLRPMILIPVWTFFLLGAWHGSNITGRSISPAIVTSGLLCFTGLLGAIYIINQITDREADLANRKLFLIPLSIIPVKSAWIETGILIGLSFVTAIMLLPVKFTLIMAASLVLGAAYSLEPVRLKRRPYWDVLANSVGNGILNTMAGWFAIGAPAEGLEILIPYPLAVASVHLTTTLADIGGDRKKGLRTSGVITGESRGITISAILMAGAVTASILVDNNQALWASLLSLPAFLVPFWKLRKGTLKNESEPSRSRILLPAKVATLAFSITAGYLFLPYLPILALLILFTRFYYRKRFGINYPSL